MGAAMDVRQKPFCPVRLCSCNYVSCMNKDSRLSGVLHCLLHMAEHDAPSTSEALAAAM